MKGYSLIAFCISMFYLINAMLPSVAGYFPDTPDQKPWDTVSAVSFLIIIVIPIISAFLPTLIRTYKLALIRSEYSLMYLSSFMFVVMLLVWTILEMSLHWKVNIRVDLFFVYAAFAVQLIIVATSKLSFDTETK